MRIVKVIGTIFAVCCGAVVLDKLAPGSSLGGFFICACMIAALFVGKAD